MPFTGTGHPGLLALLPPLRTPGPPPWLQIPQNEEMSKAGLQLSLLLPQALVHLSSEAREAWQALAPAGLLSLLETNQAAGEQACPAAAGVEEEEVGKAKAMERAAEMVEEKEGEEMVKVGAKGEVRAAVAMEPGLLVKPAKLPGRLPSTPPSAQMTASFGNRGCPLLQTCRLSQSLQAP